MKRVITLMLITLLLSTFALVALIAFGTAKPQGPLDVITNPFSSIDFRTLPPLERYRARDGAQLSFRMYAAGARQVAVLIHGSAGSSSDMHLLASALKEAGITVYVPDIRGHGSNEPHGDIAYVGQLNDDLADFLSRVKPGLPDAAWTLIGFSSGGGFALRIAAQTPLGEAFDRYVLLSPYLKYNAPSWRTAGSGSRQDAGSPAREAASTWAAVSTGRIIGLSILNRFGVHAWDGLPVISFAVPADSPSVTRTYSWRLLQNFQPHDDYLADIRGIIRPTHVYVGAADQLFVPEKMKDEFQSQRRDIPISIIADMGHSDMVTRSEAIAAIVSEFRR